MFARKTKPISVVSQSDYDYLNDHPDHPIHKYSMVLPMVELNNDEEKDEPSAPFYLIVADMLRKCVRKV